MDQTVGMPDVDVRRLFDRVAHLYDTGWLQRALYVALQDRALAELRAWHRGAIGSDRFSRLSSAASKTKVTFPTAAEMRRLATDAGFEVTAQPQIPWRFRRIAPLVLTVACA